MQQVLHQIQASYHQLQKTFENYRFRHTILPFLSFTGQEYETISLDSLE